MKENLIFLHIPKNGGTTFEPILMRYFKSNEIFNIKVLSPTSMNTLEFVEMDEIQKSKIRLLTGHMRFGMHESLIGETNYITFLRRPVDRAVSFYYFVLQNPKHRLYDTIVKNKWSLYDFVLKSKEPDISNTQIRLLSGISDSNELMLEKALYNVENHFSMVGFLDKFNESLILLKHLYSWKSIYYKKKNVNKKSVLVDSIDKEVIDAINEINKEDNILYDICEEKFKNQLKEISNLKFELKRLLFYNNLYSSTKLKKVNQLLTTLNVIK